MLYLTCLRPFCVLQICEFLRERGIGEQIVINFKEERISHEFFSTYALPLITYELIERGSSKIYSYITFSELGHLKLNLLDGRSPLFYRQIADIDRRVLFEMPPSWFLVARVQISTITQKNRGL